MFNLGIKRKIEEVLNIRIVNRSLPRGTNLFYDIGENYGLHNIKTIFDVGANIGQSSLVYNDIFKNATIYAFEPVSGIFQQLCINVKKNKRINVYNFALGDEIKDVDINIKKSPTQHSIKDVNGKIFTEKIQMTTLEAFSQKNNIPEIDFLKIDTEGFEIEVLKGSEYLLKEQKIGIILLETEIRETKRHFTTLKDIDLFLKEFGYELFGFYHQQQHWDGRKSILFMDVLYVAERLLSPQSKIDLHS